MCSRSLRNISSSVIKVIKNGKSITDPIFCLNQYRLSGSFVLFFSCFLSFRILFSLPCSWSPTTQLIKYHSGDSEFQWELHDHPMDSCQPPSSAIREVLNVQMKQFQHVSAYTGHWISKTWAGIVLQAVREGQLTAPVSTIKKINSKEKDVAYLTKNTTAAKMSTLCFSFNLKEKLQWEDKLKKKKIKECKGATM